MAREPALRQIPVDGAVQPFHADRASVLRKSRLKTVDKFRRAVGVLLAPVLLHCICGRHRAHATRDLQWQTLCQAFKKSCPIGIAAASWLDQRLGGNGRDPDVLALEIDLGAMLSEGHTDERDSRSEIADTESGLLLDDGHLVVAADD